jgi:hypothetical protein
MESPRLRWLTGASRHRRTADDGGLGTVALVDGGDLLGADGGRRGLGGGDGGGTTRAGAVWGARPGAAAARAGAAARLGARTGARAGAARGGGDVEVGGGGLKVETKVNETARGLGRFYNCLIPVGL